MFRRPGSIFREQRIPVYARWLNDQYQLRPLLFPVTNELTVRGRRVDRLLESLTRRLFREQRNARAYDFDLEEADYQKYFWSPRCRLETLKLRFRTGTHDVFGPFNAVWFDHRGHRYVILPELRHLWFMATPDERGKFRLADQVVAVMQRFFRAERERLRKRTDGNDKPQSLTFEDICSYFSSGRDFLAEIERNMDVPQRLPAVQGHDDTGMAGWRGAGLSGGSLFSIGESEIREAGEAIGEFDDSEKYPTVGREALIATLVERLQEKHNNALVLLGPQGAGRSTLIRASHQAYRKLLPQREDPRHIWSLDPVRLIAGKSIIGEWQQAFEGIIEYVRQRHKRRRSVKLPDWLYFDNPVALLRVGKSAGSELNLASMLKVHLERGKLDVVLEATPEEWQRMQEIDRSFIDLFEVLRVPALTDENVGLALTDMRRRLERDRNCRLENEALFSLMQLHGRRFREIAQPGRLAPVMMRLAVRHGRQPIGRAEVMDDFASVTRMSHELFDTEVALDSEQVREQIGSRLIGQEAALDTLVETIELIKSGLHDPGKPIASYLFIGPTGVGKTEAVKALARQLFGDTREMVRFNMNEYADAGAPRRLIGDFNQPQGQLTAQVRYRPFCILLLDEIEKAHPLVHDLLLQVMGEGRLTDALGRVTDFTNTIILMTSNLGAQQAARRLGFVESDNSRIQTYREAAERYFRPEFFNRIDRMVDFHPLEPEHIARIAQLLIDGMFKRQGLVRRGAMLRVPGPVVASLAERGFDATMGGRALRRLIEKEMTVMLAGPLAALPGDQRVVVELFMRGDQLVPRVTPLRFAAEGSVEPLSTTAIGRDKEDLEELFNDFQSMLKICNSIRGGGGRLLDDAGELGEEVRNVLQIEHRLQEKSQVIADLIEKFEWSYSRSGPTKRFILRRWPPSQPYRGNLGGWGPGYQKDRFAQFEIRDFLNEAYDRSEIIAGGDADLLDALITRRILSLKLAAWVDGAFDTVLVDYMSWVDGQGKEELEFLINKHRWILLQEGSDCLVETRHDDRYLAVWRGPALLQLLQPEQGIHLFSRSFRSDLQIQFQVTALSADDDLGVVLQAATCRHEEAMAAFSAGKIGIEELPGISGEVLRLYSDATGLEDGKVHDLRTGLIQKRIEESKKWNMSNEASYLDQLAWRQLLASSLPEVDIQAIVEKIEQEESGL